MSTNTTNWAMGKAVDGDNAKTYLETTLGSALDKVDSHAHGTDATGLAVTRYSSTSDLNARRLKASGTPHVNGDYAISVGWGNTASVTAGGGASDQKGSFTVTAGGTGIAGNPTITLTFKDLTWTSAPMVLCALTGGSGISATAVPITISPSTTAVVFQPLFTPTSGLNYIFTFICMGGPN